MNQNDKRYQKTEDAIHETIQFALKQNPRTICLRPSKIVKNAKISPSTFYRHYKDLDLAVQHNNKKMFRKFYRHFKSAQKFHPNLQTNLAIFLKYFSDNQDYFILAFSQQNTELIFKMFLLLKPQIREQYNISDETPKAFRMLFFEIYSLLENWSKANFDSEHIMIIQKDIISLLRTIKTRIPPSEQN